MTVVRIVPNLTVSDLGRASELYARLLDLQIGMDLGWVANMAPSGDSTAQLQVITSDVSAAANPTISVGVAEPADVDDVHRRVLAAGLDIVHPLTDEARGVRRFFFRDPDENVINVVANR